MSFFETLNKFHLHNQSKMSLILKKIGEKSPFHLGYHFYTTISPALPAVLDKTVQVAKCRGYEATLTSSDVMPKYGRTTINGTKITAFSEGAISAILTMNSRAGDPGPSMPVYDLDELNVSFQLEREELLSEKIDTAKSWASMNPRNTLAFTMNGYGAGVQFSIGKSELDEDDEPTDKESVVSECFSIQHILDRIYLAAIHLAPLKIEESGDSTAQVRGIDELAPGFAAVFHNSLDKDHGVWFRGVLSGGLVSLSNRYVDMDFRVVPIVVG